MTIPSAPPPPTRSIAWMGALALLAACNKPAPTPQTHAQTQPLQETPAPQPKPEPAPVEPEPEPEPPCTDMPAPLDPASLPKLLEIRQPLAGMEGVSRIVDLSVDDATSAALDCAGRLVYWELINELHVEDPEWNPDPPELKHEDPSFVAFAFAGSHTCVLTREHRVLCRGQNGSGSLGIGVAEHPRGFVPAVNLPEDVHTVLAQDGNSCALAGDGVYCWGENYENALGLGPENRHHTPTKLAPGLGLVTVATSHTHGCGVSESGEVYCWGAAWRGEAGCDPDAPGCESEAVFELARAKALPGIPKAEAVAVGVGHSCALTRAGEVYCWGDNDDGACGGPKQAQPWIPRRVEGLTKIRAIAANGWHSCALNEAGSVYCWGANHLGQVGPMPTNDYRTPVELAGLPPIAQLSLGLTHSCARTQSGQIVCWGIAGDPSD